MHKNPILLILYIRLFLEHSQLKEHAAHLQASPHFVEVDVHAGAHAKARVGELKFKFMIYRVLYDSYYDSSEWSSPGSLESSEVVCGLIVCNYRVKEA